MQIRKVQKKEFKELMHLMNQAFEMDGDGVFEKILPKFYYEENDEMIHYGVFIAGKLIASIGLYPMTMISPYGKLQAFCIGAVSTDKNYRNQGYFSLLMNKVIEHAKKNGGDIMFLTGNRYRYGRYGFENTGRKLKFIISKRTIKNLIPQSFTCYAFEDGNRDIISKALALYEKTPQHIVRTKTNFYKHLLSWKSKPYYVLANQQLIGYYAIDNENNITEFIYEKGYLDTMLLAALGDLDEVVIETSTQILDDDILSKCDHFWIEANQMYQVINWEAVYQYLNFSANLQVSSNTKMQMLEVLGSEISESVGGFASIFVHRCDQG